MYSVNHILIKHWLARQEVEAGQPDRKQRRGNEKRRRLDRRKLPLPFLPRPPKRQHVSCHTEKGTEPRWLT